MANPFKEKDGTIGGKSELTAIPEAEERPNNAAEEERPQEQGAGAPAMADDLLVDFTVKKPKAKSYGFYLDDDVVKALDGLAKKNKSSKSKVLNALLRKLLMES